MSSRKSGLGKSFQSLFGEREIKNNFKQKHGDQNLTKDEKEAQVEIDLTQKDVSKEESAKSGFYSNKAAAEKSAYDNNIEETEQQKTTEPEFEYQHSEERKIYGAPIQTENTEKEAIGNYENTASSFNNQTDSTESTEDIDPTKIQLININLIQPNLNQPRKNFDEEKISELSKSISEYGVLQPLLVKKNGPLYEIIAGERRWRAAKAAGISKVPVVIKDYDQRVSREVALIENIQRENLNAVELALAYQSLVDEYGLSQDAIAKKVSKSRSAITNTMRILKLDKEILNLIKEGKLTEGHARALLSIDENDEELRAKVAKKVVEENLSVRDIEKMVRLENLAEYRKEQAEKKKTPEYQKLNIFLKDIASKTKNKLKTKVKIIPKNKEAGHIEIEYNDQSDLDRIFLLLNSISNER